MRCLAEPAESFRAELEERAPWGVLDAGFFVNSFQGHPGEHPLPPLLQTRIGMVKGRCDQAVVCIEQQVIAGPGAATNALHGFLVGADVA